MMSFSKQKGGRSGLVNQGAKKKDQGSRSKCPQDESYQPLRGKSFYLDVRRQHAKLKKDLEDLGGVVETFLSKDISYVVSDRPEVKLECSKNAAGVMQSAASPAVSTPSPFQQSKDSAHGAVDSPSGSGGRDGMVTRGKAIVQKATISKTYGTSNVLANARNWDVSIRYIDSIVKYINKEKQKMKKDDIKSPQTQPQPRYRSGTSKERKLSRPSLKVEDSSRHYRPASKELAAWPRLSFDGNSGSSPFDVTPRDRRTVVTPRDKRRVDTPRYKRTVDTPRDKRILDTPRDKRIVDTPRDKRTVDTPRDTRLVDTPRDRGILDTPRDKRIVDTPRDKRTVDTPRDKRTVDTPRDKRIVGRPRATHDGLQRRGDDQGDETAAHHEAEDRRNIQPVPIPRRHRNVGVKHSRRGYCECCLGKYSDLEKHLSTEQHLSFVRESNCYANLDAMIDEGPNMEQFLADVMHHHRWQSLEGIRNMEDMDEVTLVSSPNMKELKKGSPQVDSRARELATKSLLGPAAPASHAEVARGAAATSAAATSAAATSADDCHADGPASRRKSPREESQTRQTAGAEGRAAPGMGCQPAGRLDEDAAGSEEGERPSPGDRPAGARPNLGSGESEPGPVRQSSGTGITPRGRQTAPMDSQSPPARHSLRLSRQAAHRSSPTNPAQNSPVTPKEQRQPAHRFSPTNPAQNAPVLPKQQRQAPHRSPTNPTQKAPISPNEQRQAPHRSSSPNSSENTPVTPKEQRQPSHGSSPTNHAENAPLSPKEQRQAPHRSPTNPAENTPVTPKEQSRNAACQPPSDTGGGREPADSQDSMTSPTTPSRRKSCRLSLTAQRRQRQQAKALAVDPVPPDQPSVSSKEREGPAIPVNTPQTAAKRPRSLRLSLTARKRLLRESAVSRPDLNQAPGVSENSCQARLKDSAQVEGQNGGTEPHPEEAGRSKAESDVASSSTDEPQTGLGNKRQSKRKRNSTDHQDFRIGKRPRHNTTNAAQRKSQSDSEETSEKTKNRGGAQPSPCKPQDHGEPSERMGEACAKSPQQNPAQAVRGEPPAQPVSLASLFDSDPNAIQSSFLGFGSDDITETEQRLQLLSASSTLYTSKLQEAALNVYCIPSSELNLPEEGDSGSASSEDSNMEEVCVGMALRNLANFPSDGSDWEAKVGGFMSVRLDKAVQMKQDETLLARAYARAKENMKENQYRQAVNIPSKLTATEGRDRENMTAQSERSPRKSQSKLKNQKDSGRPLPGDSELSLTRRTLDFGGGHKSRSGRPNAELRTRSRGVQSSPLRQTTSPRKDGRASKTCKPQCSTPKRARRLLDDRKYNLLFSPDTPKEDRELIIENYIHDVSENEIDFPKFSSPLRADTIVSPIRRFAKAAPGGKGSSPFKLKSPRVLRELSGGGSPRKTLFRRRRHSTSSVPCRVFHFLLNPPGSPRKRDPSPPWPSSPLKQTPADPGPSPTSPQQPECQNQITYIPINERNKVSPTFCTNAKPHFSSHILHPPNKKRRSDRLRSTSLAGSSVPHRPARTWSMCVSIDDIGRCEDVYEFTDDTAGNTHDPCPQSSPRGKTDRDSDKKSPNQPNRRKSVEDRDTGKDKDTADSSQAVVEEFGLPFSFFM